MLNGLYHSLEFFVIQIRVSPGGSHSMRPSTSGSYRSYSTTREDPVAGLGPANHVFFGRIVLASRRGYPGQARARGRLSQDPTLFEPGCLDRRITLQHDAVEISQLFHIVI